MLDELTPLQAYELFCYSAEEPFGELRDDLRSAAQQQLAYDIARGGKGKKLALGDFVLYKDVREATQQQRGTQSLIITLDRMAQKAERRKATNGK